MERKILTQASMLIWALVAGLLSQSLVISVMSARGIEDQKNYYTRDPHAGSPPTGSYTTPSHGSYGTPSHGSHGYTPPANCGNPPSGGHYDPTPTPSRGGHSGGGYYHSPPTGGSTHLTPTIISPPASPLIDPTLTPPTRGHSGGGYYYSPPTGGSNPSTPTIISPPTSPFINPGTPPIPGVSVPSPPFDPNSPPYGGTCNFWSTHPGLIWGLFGWSGVSVGGAFGVPSIPGFGANMSLHQALTNTRTDGLGALYREGAASLLNSMVNKKFPFTTTQIRDSFITALSSNKAAAAQAQLFKLANEGRA